LVALSLLRGLERVERLHNELYRLARGRRGSCLR
jgi:hypothetical protein